MVVLGVEVEREVHLAVEIHLLVLFFRLALKLVEVVREVSTDLECDVCAYSKLVCATENVPLSLCCIMHTHRLFSH